MKSPLTRLSRVQRVGLFVGPVVFALVAFVPSELHRIPSYAHRPAAAAAVAALMAILWLTEALPIAWTACLPLVLYPLLGVFGKGPWGDTVASFEPFLDAYIFLFLGGMAIGAAMEERNLHRRLALHVLRAVGTQPARLLLGMLVATAAVSMWISNTATAVMMVPIGVAVLSELERSRGGQPLPHFGGALLLAVAYASNVGGIGTKIGTGTNSIFSGFVAEQLGRDLGFLEYMAVGTPFVVLFIPIVWGVLWVGARKDTFDASAARATLDENVRQMGPMTAMEKRVAAVFAAAALLWIVGDPVRELLAPLVKSELGFTMKGKHYEATVAMLAALVLLAQRALTWQGIRRIPFGTLLLLGGSFAMAAGIEGGGLSQYMSARLVGIATLPVFQQMLLASAATIALSAVASNTATVNVALNVLPGNLGVLLSSSIAASCDFMLPAGTPPNAIVFGSGRVKLPTMIRSGFALDVLAALLVALYCYFYAGPLLG
jgi:sodium-dependent dicarboxylate transporter 2/3/5